MSTPPRALLLVAHCCRDWPVSAFNHIGRCGECGERPKIIDKPIEQYDAERAVAASTPPQGEKS